MRRKDLEELSNIIKVYAGALRQYADPMNWDLSGDKPVCKVSLNVAREVLKIGSLSDDEVINIQNDKPKQDDSVSQMKKGQWIK